jgi:hypothetical protein
VVPFFAGIVGIHSKIKGEFMNIIQARILEQNKQKVDTRPRTNFVVTKWGAEGGEIADGTGYRYAIVSADLALECEGYLEEGSRVSGIVDGPYVSNILIESGERSIELLQERKEFDSVGPDPDTRGWEPRGTPDTGLRGGRPDSGRFSHPQNH